VEALYVSNGVLGTLFVVVVVVVVAAAAAFAVFVFKTHGTKYNEIGLESDGSSTTVRWNL
jgi:hypothetical protein